MATCPICHVDFAGLVDHLRNVHLMLNAEERVIMSKLARGAVGIRKAPCPVPGCAYQKENLPRHLVIGHVDFSVEQQLAWTGRARLAEATRLLAALRSTNPAVPMVTTWDQDDGEEAVLAAEKGPCPEPACVAYRELAQRQLVRQSWQLQRTRQALEHQRAVSRWWQRRAQTVRVST